MSIHQHLCFYMKSLLVAYFFMFPSIVCALEPGDTISEPSVKENQFSIVLDAFSRGEIRKGGLPEESDDNLASFIVERTLLKMSYERPGLIASVAAQHSGTWGSNETNSLNIYEAWTQLHSKGGFFAKVGRQSISYDDQRIFGADNWAMTAMSHDALKLGYEGHGHKIHLIGAYNQNNKNKNGGSYFSGGIQPYKSMEALWYHYDMPHIPLGASVLFMNVGMQNSDIVKDTCTFYQQLTGAYFSYRPSRFSAEAAFYYQFGKQEDGLPLEAWMASTKLAYRPQNNLRVYAGYDYLSGDKDFAVPAKGMIGLIRHRTIRGFSSIYGSHHKFYGAMDFFYVTTYNGGFTPGLQNIYIGSSYSPVKNLMLGLSYHYLVTATSLRDNDRSLGHEVELSASYRLMKDVTLGAGYSFMRGTKTMEALKRTSNDRQLQWAWLMLSVSPKVFTSMW